MAAVRRMGKYLLLKKHVREHYGRGDRLPSESELSRKVGISRYATLRALNELSAEGFIRREQGRGTFVTGGPAPSQGAVAGTLMFVADEFEGGDIVEILRGVEEGCRFESMGVALSNSNYDRQVEASNLRQLTRNGYAGAVMLVSGHETIVEELEGLVKSQFPFVLVDRHVEEIDCPCVELDHEKAAYEAVKYLIGVGHRKIAHITAGFSARKRISSVRDRESGYRMALSEAGIPVREEYIQHSSILNIDESPTAQKLMMMSYIPMHKLLCLPDRPSAVFLVNDMFAAGAYEAITNSGLRVPDDVSLIAIGGNPAVRTIPVSLTMMVQPCRSIGRASVSILKQLMAGREIEEKLVRFDARLVVQDSTAPPNL